MLKLGDYMNIKLNLGIIFFLMISPTCMAVSASESVRKIEEKNVISVVKHAEAYIQQYGKSKGINRFKKNSSLVFAIDFKGKVLASPIHPETVGTNQIDFRDPTGTLVVQEEINKAITGGGWLKGRYRKNHTTGQYECRRLYIHPMKGNYFIGSWYYYAVNKNSKCLI
jgi:hypothetical protein